MHGYLLAVWGFVVAYRWVLLLGAYQYALTFLPHPRFIVNPWLRTLVSVVTRFSVLRLRQAPGTPHLIGTAQPWWTPEQLEERLGELLELQTRTAPPRPPEVPTSRQIITWLQPAALLLALPLLGACTVLTAPRKATSAALQSAQERARKLKAWSATEELQILGGLTAPTREEARARIDPFRKAVDYCTEEVLRPGLIDLRQIAQSMDGAPGPAAAPPPVPPATPAAPAPPAPAPPVSLPSPYQPPVPGGAR